MLVILILILLAHIFGVGWPVEPIISRILAVLFVVIALVMLISGYVPIGGMHPLLR